MELDDSARYALASLFSLALHSNEVRVESRPKQLYQRSRTAQLHCETMRIRHRRWHCRRCELAPKFCTDGERNGGELLTRAQRFQLRVFVGYKQYTLLTSAVLARQHHLKILNTSEEDPEEQQNRMSGLWDVYWGYDLVRPNGLLEKVFRRLKISETSWEGLKVLPEVRRLCNMWTHIEGCHRCRKLFG